MSQTGSPVAYDRQMFAAADSAAIRKAVEHDGWDTVVVVDAPGTNYAEHEHVKSKLLVFLHGSMIVETDGLRFHCEPGDQLVIPGSMRHAAWVGDEGCTFFWSEQVRERT